MVQRALGCRPICVREDERERERESSLNHTRIIKRALPEMHTRYIGYETDM